MSDPLTITVVVMLPVLAGLIAIEHWAVKRGGVGVSLLSNVVQAGALAVLVLLVAGRQRLGLVGEGDHLEALLAAGLLLLVLVRVGQIVWALSGVPPAAGRSRPGWPFLLLPFLVYLAVLPWAASQRQPDGDEPYFLLITHSLVHDFDSELTNNYAEEHSLLFTSRALEPEWADPVRPDGRRYSRHSAVLPAILAPGYAIAGKWGAMVTMALIATLVGWSCLHLALRLWGIERWWESIWVWALLTMTPPVLIYSHQIWAELPAALMVLAALHRIRDLEDGNRPTRRSWLSLALLLILLPMLKLRFAILSIPLLFLAWWRSGSSRRTIAWIGLALIATIGAILLFNYIVFDKPFKDHSLAQLLRIQGRSPLDYLQGLVGLFWDCSFGLLASNPLWLLLVPAVGLALWQSSPRLTDLLICVGPYLALVAPRREWYGAWSPPFRFGMVLLPLLALLLVPLLERRGRAGARFLLGGLTTLAAALLLLWTVVPGWTYNLAVGTHHLIDHLSIRLAADVGRFFPSLVRLRTASWLVPLLSLSLAMLLWWYPRKRPREAASWATAWVLLAAAALPLAATRVPTAVVEFEDRQVAKAGGELHPGPWVPYRPRYRGGWILRSGESLRAPVVALGERVTIEIDIRVRGRWPNGPQVEIWAGEALLGALTLTEGGEWQSLTLEESRWPAGADLRIAVTTDAEPDAGANLIFDRARLSWQ